MKNYDLKIDGIYRHYKGGTYKLKGFAVEESTGDTLVLYHETTPPGVTGMATPPLWARPLTEFVGQIAMGERGDFIRRFELIELSEAIDLEEVPFSTIKIKSAPRQPGRQAEAALAMVGHFNEVARAGGVKNIKWVTPHGIADISITKGKP